MKSVCVELSKNRCRVAEMCIAGGVANIMVAVHSCSTYVLSQKVDVVGVWDTQKIIFKLLRFF